MKKATLLSLVILLALVLYLALTVLFTTIFQEVSQRQVARSDTPAPTFTPTPVATAVVVVIMTPTPPALIPTTTPTSSPTPEPSPTDSPTSTPTPTPAVPQLWATTTVNVRSGPGTNYPVIATLPPNVPLVITGRNEPGTWWQAQAPDGRTGWVAASVVQTSPNVDAPIVQAPPPPPPPTPAPPSPTPKPAYQYEPTGWYDDTNYGLTRFLGTITDVDGNPVGGVFVEAQCGDFRVISDPSGPANPAWPPGFYDITLDTKPIPCKWGLTVVATEDRKTVTARLSETIEVETTIDKSIVVANWRKNW